MNRVMIIDDEAGMRENVQRMLRSADFAVEGFEDPAVALRHALAGPPDVMLLDIKMPGMSGEELFARFHEAHPSVPVVFLTAFGSVEGAVIAMRNGASDYLQKPFRREDLLLAIQRALKQSRLAKEVQALRGRLDALGETDVPQTRNAAMAAEVDKAARAAATDATVLILGESGAGKEVMARFIHHRSARREGPFVPVECTAVPGTLIESELFGYERGAFTGADRTKKGLIESAEGGTLFLDEIGDLGVELQTRLFRFVEERELRRVGGVQPLRVDCRIVCATNQDLEAKIDAGAFRKELYYRLSVVTLRLPPLRERPEDVPHLAAFFLERFARRYGKTLSASPQFLDALAAQPWPGNVRQLRNMMERLVALHPGGTLGCGDAAGETAPVAPANGFTSLAWKEARERFDASYARTLLARNGGNVSAAAREAGVDRKTFYAMLDRNCDNPETGDRRK